MLSDTATGFVHDLALGLLIPPAMRKVKYIASQEIHTKYLV
jgi:hypothetical protein